MQDRVPLSFFCHSFTFFQVRDCQYASRLGNPKPDSRALWPFYSQSCPTYERKSRRLVGLGTQAPGTGDLVGRADQRRRSGIGIGTRRRSSGHRHSDRGANSCSHRRKNHRLGDQHRLCNPNRVNRPNPTSADDGSCYLYTNDNVLLVVNLNSGDIHF